MSAEKGNVNVTATERFENTPTGNLVAAKDVNVNANDVTLAGNVTAGENANITAKNNATVNGNVTGKDVKLEAGKDLTTGENANITATEGNVTLNATNITNSGNVSAEKGNVNVNATNFTNTETGNLVASKDINVNVTNMTNNGNITSRDGQINVNATGTATNNAIIQAKASVNINGGTVNNNYRIVSDTGVVNLNGTVNNNGFIGPEYCINGQCGNVFIDQQRGFKDNQLIDLVDAQHSVEREVRSSLRGGEITLHQSGDAKTVTLFNDGREVNKVVSVISNGAVCSATLSAGVDTADKKSLASCIAANAESKGQYHEVFQGKVQKGNNKHSAGKALKGR